LGTYELADDISCAIDLDVALVDAHLEAVPGLGTLTARGLAGDDLEDLYTSKSREEGTIRGKNMLTVSAYKERLSERLNLEKD